MSSTTLGGGDSVSSNEKTITNDDVVFRIERELQAGHQELLAALLSVTSLSSSANSEDPQVAAATLRHVRGLLQNLVESSNGRMIALQGPMIIVKERLNVHESEEHLSSTQGAFSNSHGHMSLPPIPAVMGYSPAASDMRVPTFGGPATSLSLPGGAAPTSQTSNQGANSPADPFSLSGTFGRVVFAEGSPQMTPTDGSHRVSRAASFARAGSFSRKRQDGVDVVMFSQESASPDIGAAINETWSMASRGSWRRRSTVAGGMGVAHTVDIRRRSYLPIVELEGMPALNLDDPGELRSRFSRKSTRHTAVFRSEGDLESLLDECDIPRIHDVNSPEFNLFDEFKSFGDETFTVVVMNVLLKYNFVTSLGLNVSRLLAYVRRVRQFYRPNPFHNALHAADVVQTTHVYLCQRDVKENFTDVELLSVLFAAMVIDLGHLGVSNEFLAKTKHPIAKLYSESSPHECMHCAFAFCLLDQPDLNFFADSPVWSVAKDVDFRFLVSTFVLGSDSTKHSDLLVSVDHLLSQGRIDDDQVPQLLTAIVHAADVNYVAKPRHIFVEWASRYMAESFLQGEAERRYFAAIAEEEAAQRELNVQRDAAGGTAAAATASVADDELLFFEVSKMCNRELIDPVELQLSIVEFVVLPYMTILRQVLPNVWFERLQFNHDFLQVKGGGGGGSGPGASAPIASTARAPPSAAAVSGGPLQPPTPPPMSAGTSLQASQNNPEAAARTESPAAAILNDGIDRHMADARAIQQQHLPSLPVHYFAADDAADATSSSGGGGDNQLVGLWGASDFLQLLGDWLRAQTSTNLAASTETSSGAAGMASIANYLPTFEPAPLPRRSITHESEEALAAIAAAAAAAAGNAGASGSAGSGSTLGAFGGGGGGGLSVIPPNSARSVSSNSAEVTTPAAHRSRTLNAIFAMCSELLSHVYALVNAFEGNPIMLSSAPSSPGARKWSVDDEIRRFAVEWIKFVRTLEEATQTRFLDAARGSSPAFGDDATQQQQQQQQQPTVDEAVRMIKAMRDVTPPHPNRSRVDTTFNPNAPAGIAVLLTQMWWIVCAALNEHMQDRARRGGNSDSAAFLSASAGGGTMSGGTATSSMDVEANSFQTSPQTGVLPLHDPQRHHAPRTPENVSSNLQQHQQHQQHQSPTVGPRSAGAIRGVGSLRNMMAPSASSAEAAGPYFRREPPSQSPTETLPEFVAGGGAFQRRRESVRSPTAPLQQSSATVGGSGVAHSTTPDPLPSAAAAGSPMKYVLNRRVSKSKS